MLSILKAICLYNIYINHVSILHLSCYEHLLTNQALYNLLPLSPSHSISRAIRPRAATEQPHARGLREAALQKAASSGIGHVMAIHVESRLIYIHHVLIRIYNTMESGVWR